MGATEGGWRVERGGAGGFVWCEALAAAGLARHGVTTRDGALNLSFRTEPDPARVVANRAAACALFGTTLDALVVPEQIHAASVAAVGAADRGRGARSTADAVPGADALVTDTPGVLLALTVSDCLPVFLLDTAHHALGLAHSGWRGTAGRIAANTLELMAERYGTRPADVMAAIGPGIEGCCYEVGGEVRAALLEAGAPQEALRPSPAGRWMLDLKPIVVAQLVECGVPSEAISVAPWCTHCAADLFFSHRRDGPTAGRMGAFAALS